MAVIVEDMNPANEEQLVRFARVLATLGERHGLSNFRKAGEGQVIADIEKGRTYFDVAGFELEAENLLQAGVSVVLSGTEFAAQVDRGPLTADQVA